MKHLKMLGLAAVTAVALMAVAGSGSASATVLCKTTPTNNDCPKAWDYEKGTQISASAKAGGSILVEETGGTSVTTCTGGSLKGKTTNTGGANETVDGTNEELVWNNCKAAVVTKGLGSFEIHAEENHNGVVTGKLNEITVVTALSVSCVYGTGSGATLGTIESGESATLNINAVLSLVSGGITCPPTVRWTSTYAVTSPSPIFFAMTLS